MEGVKLHPYCVKCYRCGVPINAKNFAKVAVRREEKKRGREKGEEKRRGSEKDANCQNKWLALGSF